MKNLCSIILISTCVINSSFAQNKHINCCGIDIAIPKLRTIIDTIPNEPDLVLNHVVQPLNRSTADFEVRSYHVSKKYTDVVVLSCQNGVRSMKKYNTTTGADSISPTSELKYIGVSAHDKKRYVFLYEKDITSIKTFNPWKNLIDSLLTNNLFDLKTDKELNALVKKTYPPDTTAKEFTFAYSGGYNIIELKVGRFYQRFYYGPSDRSFFPYKIKEFVMLNRLDRLLFTILN